MTMICGLTSHVCLLMFLYFIQGLPYGIQTHFLPVYLRTRGTDLTEISLFRLLQAPWLFKVVWAPLIDSYSTRRQWLLFSISALVLSCILSGIFSPQNLNPLAVVALFLCNIFASMQDVSVDAVALSILSGDELAAGNVAQIVGYKLGAAFAGGILALLVSVLGWIGMCFIMGAIYAEAALLVYVSPVLRNIDRNTSEIKDHHHHCSDNSHKPVECHHHVHCHLSNGSSSSGGGNNQNSLLHHRHCHITHCSHEHVKDPAKQHHSLMRIGQLMQQLYVQPGTLWLMVFLFIYKLGKLNLLLLPSMKYKLLKVQDWQLLKRSKKLI
jgi:MFS family permease